MARIRHENSRWSNVFCQKYNSNTAITAKFDGDTYAMDIIIKKPTKYYSARMDTLCTYHRRIGHINLSTLLRMAKLNAVIGLERVKAIEKVYLQYLQHGETIQTTTSDMDSHVTKPLQIGHSDTCVSDAHRLPVAHDILSYLRHEFWQWIHWLSSSTYDATQVKSTRTMETVRCYGGTTNITQNKMYQVR